MSRSVEYIVVKKIDLEQACFKYSVNMRFVGETYDGAVITSYSTNQYEDGSAAKKLAKRHVKKLNELQGRLDKSNGVTNEKSISNN